MNKTDNFDLKDVKVIGKSFPWEPQFNKVIITLNKASLDDEMTLSDNTLDNIQYIIKSGPNTKDLNIGDRVLLDLDKLMVKELSDTIQGEYSMRLKINPIYDDEGRMFALIEDRHILAKSNFLKQTEINLNA